MQGKSAAKRGAAHPLRRAHWPPAIVAGASMTVAMLLLLPLGSGTPPPSTVSAPWTGTHAVAYVTATTNGCAKGTVVTPTFAPKTGLINTGATGNARSCPSALPGTAPWSRAYSTSELLVSIPVSGGAGAHWVNTSVTVSIHGSWRSTFGACPAPSLNATGYGASACSVFLAIGYGVSVYLYDLTNGTYLDSATEYYQQYAAVDTYNITSCSAYACSSSVGSYPSNIWTNGTTSYLLVLGGNCTWYSTAEYCAGAGTPSNGPLGLVASHHYTDILYVDSYVVASIYGYPGSLAGSVSASAPTHGTWLSSISVS